MPKAVLVIPTYNERENLADLVRAILDLHLGLEILIVDDNSPDGTGAVADKLAAQYPQAHVLHRSGKLGLGTAYVDGFKSALGMGADYVLEMDADFSHDPKYLPKLLKRIESCDLVLGSRYMDGISVINWSFWRLVISLLANKYVQIVTGMRYSDCLGGFKCFRRHVLERIGLDKIIANGYVFQMEMLYRAHQQGFRIDEVPIVFYDRDFGVSKMSKRTVVEAFFVVLVLRFTVRSQRRGPVAKRPSKPLRTERRPRFSS